MHIFFQEYSVKWKSTKKRLLNYAGSPHLQTTFMLFGLCNEHATMTSFDDTFDSFLSGLGM